MGNDRTHRLRILCVDDDADVRLIVELSLRLDPDIEAVAVSSATEAIRLLSNSTYDLVLLDAVMPGVSGPDFLRQITRPNGSPPVPVIFLTADAVHRRRYEQLGAIGVICKPFDPVGLAHCVRELLMQGFGQNKSARH